MDGGWGGRWGGGGRGVGAHWAPGSPPGGGRWGTQPRLMVLAHSLRWFGSQSLKKCLVCKQPRLVDKDKVGVRVYQGLLDAVETIFFVEPRTRRPHVCESARAPAGKHTCADSPITKSVFFKNCPAEAGPRTPNGPRSPNGPRPICNIKTIKQ